MAGKNDKKALYVVSSESCQPNTNLFGVGTKLKESIFKSNNQINPLLQPEHEFCQKNRSERGQAQDWYRMKQWWWYPFVSMVDVVLQGAWVLY